MRRRDLLSLASAAGLSIVASSFWKPTTALAHADNDWLFPADEWEDQGNYDELDSIADELRSGSHRAEAVDGIYRVNLFGRSHASALGQFDILRPAAPGTQAYPLFRIQLNTLDSILQWAAPPGEEFIGPMNFVLRGNMAAQIVGVRDGRRVMCTYEPGAAPMFIPMLGHDSVLHPLPPRSAGLGRVLKSASSTT